MRKIAIANFGVGAVAAFLLALMAIASAADVAVAPMQDAFKRYTLDSTTPTDAVLQSQIETIDRRLRARHSMNEEQTAVGVLDLKTLRLALIRPDVSRHRNHDRTGPSLHRGGAHASSERR